MSVSIFDLFNIRLIIILNCVLFGHHWLQLSESVGEELDIAFSVSDVKNKYKVMYILLAFFYMFCNYL